jgi:hypothetical protein
MYGDFLALLEAVQKWNIRHRMLMALVLLCTIYPDKKMTTILPDFGSPLVLSRRLSFKCSEHAANIGKILTTTMRQIFFWRNT